METKEIALNLAAEAVAQGMVVTDKSGIILWSNEKFANILEAPTITLLGNQNLMQVLPDSPQKVSLQRLTSLVLQKDQTHSGQWSHTLDNGSVMWYNVEGIPLKQGQEYLFAFHDISKIRRYETQLRESQSRWRMLADNSVAMLWVANKDMMITFCNKAWCDYVGRPMELELGFGWTESLHPEEKEYLTDCFHEIFLSRKVFEVEYRVRRKDGKYGWLLERGTPIYNHENEFIGVVGTAFEITDRKYTELLLQAKSDAMNTIENQHLAKLTQDIQNLEMTIAAIPEEASAGDWYTQMEQTLDGLKATQTEIKQSLDVKVVEPPFEKPEIIYYD